MGEGGGEGKGVVAKRSRAKGRKAAQKAAVGPQHISVGNHTQPLAPFN